MKYVGQTAPLSIRLPAYPVTGEMLAAITAALRRAARADLRLSFRRGAVAVRVAESRRPRHRRSGARAGAHRARSREHDAGPQRGARISARSSAGAKRSVLPRAALSASRSVRPAHRRGIRLDDRRAAALARPRSTAGTTSSSNASRRMTDTVQDRSREARADQERANQHLRHACWSRSCAPRARPTSRTRWISPARSAMPTAGWSHRDSRCPRISARSCRRSRAAWTTSADDIGEGDILASNDPYSGCSHLNDIFMFKPVFARGRRDRLPLPDPAPHRSGRARAGRQCRRQRGDLPGRADRAAEQDLRTRAGRTPPCCGSSSTTRASASA